MDCDSLQILLDQKILVDSIFVANPDTLTTNVFLKTISERNDTLGEFYKNIATILAALIAGFIALYQVKSNTVSSARIKWIESLKKDISELCESAISTKVHWDSYSGIQGDEDKRLTFYNHYFESHSKFTILLNRVFLNLNPNEKDPSKLKGYILNINTLLDSDSERTNCSITKISDMTEDISTLSNKIFRDEWKRAKSLFINGSILNKKNINELIIFSMGIVIILLLYSLILNT